MFGRGEDPSGLDGDPNRPNIEERTEEQEVQRWSGTENERSIENEKEVVLAETVSTQDPATPTPFVSSGAIRKGSSVLCAVVAPR